MIQRFKDKTAIITGASSGIGASAARQFIIEGANVALIARNKDNLDKIVAQTGSEKAIAISADVTDLDKMSAVIQQVKKHFGAIHILVNNAGFNSRGPIDTRPLDEVLHIVDLNLRSPIALTRLVLPLIKEAGTGAVVNVASLAGRYPLPDEATYSATKFGLRAFTYALAEENRGTGVTVSVVSPGPVDTGFIMGDIDEVPDLVFSQPMSSPKQVAAAILDCAYDGKVERAIPRVSGYLATAGYLFPGLQRKLRPLLKRKGHKNKLKYKTRA